MPNIPKTYASPGLRWGLFLHDHPHAPDPTFRLAAHDDPDVNVPEAFAKGGEEKFTGEFVVCTIDPADGSGKIVAWREIPGSERRSGSWHELAKTPDNWRKLTTMALGRALKQAGYADDTEDLKALLLWRRRDVEMRMLEAGVSPPPALGTGPADTDLDAAARPTPHAEHPDSAAAAGETDDEEVTVGADDQWSPDAAARLRPLVDRLSPAQRDDLQAWADSRGYGPIQQLSTGGPFRLVVARATGLLPKGDPDPTPNPITPAPEPPSAPSGQPVAAVDPDAKAPMPMVRSVHDAVMKLIDPETGNREAAARVFEKVEFLAFDGWEEEGLTFGQVGAAWAALRSEEIYG